MDDARPSTSPSRQSSTKISEKNPMPSKEGVVIKNSRFDQ